MLLGMDIHAPCRLLPLSRMARRLHVTVAWLRSEAEAGRVPCLRAGRCYLFSPVAVELAISQRAASEYVVAGGEQLQAGLADDVIELLEATA